MKSKSWIAVCLAFFCYGGCSNEVSTHDRQADGNVKPKMGVPTDVMVVETLAINWLAHECRLQLALELPASYPLPQHMRLILNRAGNSIVVQSIGDFDGCALLTNEKQALSFVRIRTSPKFVNVLDSSIVEIVPTSRVDGDFVFGDDRLASYLRRASDGTFGVVSDETMKQFGISAATVTSKDGGYQIRRAICTIEENASPQFYIVTESVSVQGHYEVMDKEPLDHSRLAGLNIRIDALDDLE